MALRHLAAAVAVSVVLNRATSTNATNPPSASTACLDRAVVVVVAAAAPEEGVATTGKVPT